MFDFDAEFGDVVFDYCRERLSLDPVPLDYGGLIEIPPEKMAGLIRPEGRSPEAVLDFFRTTLAPSVVSIDSPGFLAFIPNAPTKNSLLFDMVVACSGLNGTSWLESSGVVIAENQALTFLADVAGMPSGSGGAFVSGGSIGNLSALTVARDVGRVKRPEFNPREVRFAVSEDAHSSVGKALHVLDVESLVVATDDFGRPGQAVLVHVGQDHVQTTAGESVGHRQSDPARCSGDHRDLARCQLHVASCAPPRGFPYNVATLGPPTPEVGVLTRRTVAVARLPVPSS